MSYIKPIFFYTIDGVFMVGEPRWADFIDIERWADGIDPDDTEKLLLSQQEASKKYFAACARRIQHTKTAKPLRWGGIDSFSPPTPLYERLWAWLTRRATANDVLFDKMTADVFDKTKDPDEIIAKFPDYHWATLAADDIDNLHLTTIAQANEAADHFIRAAFNETFLKIQTENAAKHNPDKKKS